jgi:pimeloyl-ACP methyl ester carboxylesterase
VHTLDVIENLPVQSDTPTLILTGRFDPITPPAWGALAAETLPNSTVYEFPNSGHWQMRSSICALNTGLAFFQDPTAPPDGACIAALDSPAFR